MLSRFAKYARGPLAASIVLCTALAACSSAGPTEEVGRASLDLYFDLWSKNAIRDAQWEELGRLYAAGPVEIRDLNPFPEIPGATTPAGTQEYAEWRAFEAARRALYERSQSVSYDVDYDTFARSEVDGEPTTTVEFTLNIEGATGPLQRRVLSTLTWRRFEDRYRIVRERLDPVP